MRYYLNHFSVLIISLFFCFYSNANMTLDELFFDDSKSFHLKIIESIPEIGIVQMGPKDAENTIIEFMDYFCGYCKKIHPELIKLIEERDDTRVVFIQHPILSQSSKVIAAMVVAANKQGKGLELHNKLFSIEGSLNQQKLDKIFQEINLNTVKLGIDISTDEINNIVKLSSFLANGAGARGTPTLFVNEEFFGGYVPLERIKSLLR